MASSTDRSTKLPSQSQAAAAASSQQVTLIRPAVWQGGVHPCYSVSVQPSIVASRQRVATASAGEGQTNTLLVSRAMLQSSLGNQAQALISLNDVVFAVDVKHR